MRKIIFLFLVSIFVPVQSQTISVCEYVEAVAQVNSSTCPEAPSLWVDVHILPNTYEFLNITLRIRNLKDLSEMRYEVPFVPGEFYGISIQTEPLIVGDEYEVKLIIHAPDIEEECEVQPSSLITIPACSTLDQDNDKFNADVDCDDRNSNIFPGATEICNFKDDDCDGTIDEGVNYTYYWDEDDDGFGDPQRPVQSCSSTPTNKLSENNLDCDDLDDTVFPGAPELCDEKDNNCDSVIDEGCPTCSDGDEDGICDADDNCASIPNADQADNDSDGVGDACDICLDLPNPDQEPDADCDGVPTGIDCDDADETVTTTIENDADCDGVPSDIDCNDNDASIISTNVNDADCDGVPTGIDCDDSDETVTTTNENDADCDGVSSDIDCDDNDPNIGSNANDADCDGSLNADDCVDDNPNIYPGAIEACGNGVDDNCDGQIDENCDCPGDADCDGFITSEDCDDTDSNVNPGATEVCGNSIDDNCDGQIDENCDTCIDGDADGICDDVDNCPTLYNPEQDLDGDCDGVPTGLDCNDRDATIKSQLDLDTDGDGVADCNDQEVDSLCTQVDLKGVSIDSDNDGVPNCVDSCPNDRTITAGDCPTCTSTNDTDGDEVPDCRDQELRSPCTGEDVDSITGVSKDEDHDGVPNCLDICPGGDDNIDTDKDKIPDACDLSNDVRGEPICHVGRNGTSRTIYVSPQQKARHLAHGDEQGACSPTNGQAQASTMKSNLTVDQVVVYPNPASEELNVQVNSVLSSGAVLSVHDFNGNTFMQIPVSEGGLYTLELDRKFVSGMYFVKITDGGTEVTKQFVVK